MAETGFQIRWSIHEITAANFRFMLQNGILKNNLKLSLSFENTLYSGTDLDVCTNSMFFDIPEGFALPWRVYPR